MTKPRKPRKPRTPAPRRDLDVDERNLVAHVLLHGMTHTLMVYDVPESQIRDLLAAATGSRYTAREKYRNPNLKD